MSTRDYEPAVVIHVVGCVDVPQPVGIIYPARALGEAFPNGRPHHCFQREAITQNRQATVERIHYEPHSYVPSTIFPDGAVRPLCRTCRGTHGEAPPGTSSSAVLPPTGKHAARRVGRRPTQ